MDQYDCLKPEPAWLKKNQSGREKIDIIVDIFISNLQYNYTNKYMNNGVLKIFFSRLLNMISLVKLIIKQWPILFFQKLWNTNHWHAI